MFQSFSELERYASRTVDTELAGKIRIVRTFNHTLPRCLSRIRQKCVHDISTAGTSPTKPGYNFLSNHVQLIFYLLEILKY